MEIFSPLMGVSFRGKEMKDLVATLTVGEDKFTFEAEPDNAYDSNAVKVIYHDDEDDTFFIGYVAKENNAPLAMALRDGEEPRAHIVSFENTFKPLLLIQW